MRDAGVQLSEVGVRVRGAALLDSVSAVFAAGTVTAVLGPNGAGKSTLLAVAAGLRRPSSGRVMLSGGNVSQLPAPRLARLRSVMVQHTEVAFAFTVRQVLEMGRTAWNDSAIENRRAVDAAVVKTQLGDLLERDVTSLSGGERQRVAFTRTLVQAPADLDGHVLLFDEPTSAMDLAHAERTLETIRDCARAGAAVAIVLHDLDAAVSFADHAVLLRAGRRVAAGTVAEVCTPERLSDVYGTAVDVVEFEGRPRVLPRRVWGA